MMFSRIFFVCVIVKGNIWLGVCIIGSVIIGSV